MLTPFVKGDCNKHGEGIWKYRISKGAGEYASLCIQCEDERQAWIDAHNKRGEALRKANNVEHRKLP